MASILFLPITPVLWLWFVGWSRRDLPFVIAALAAALFVAALLSFKRSKALGWRVFLGYSLLMTALITVSQLTIPFADKAFKSWTQWFASGCGIRKGMSAAEAVEAINSRAKVNYSSAGKRAPGPSENLDYFVDPRGIALLYTFDLNVHQVQISLDAEGKVVSVSTSTYD